MDTVKNSSHLSDTELWNEFHEGNDDILTIIYKKYANDLFDYGLKISCNQQLVQDCIQEIFLHLIKKKKKLVINSNIRFYLHKSLRNRIIEVWRSENVKQKKYDQMAIQEKEIIILDVEREIIRKEEDLRIKRKLINVIKSLTGKQQEIITLKFTEGLSYDEIAVLLKIDKASARTLLYRTLKSIKEKIDIEI